MFDRSGQVLAVAILFFVLSWLSVSLRCYVKIRILKQFGWDDGFMMATLGFFTAYLACQIGGVVHGTGKHRSVLTDENAEKALRFWFFCEIFYTISTCILKVAIGLFFLRIAVVRYQVWIIKAIMYSSGVLGVVYCCIVLFQCHPISFWWDLNPDHHGVCLSASVMADTSYTVSALNSLADWVFGILPIFIVKDLQMRRRTKIIAIAVLGFAAVGSAATIIRMPYIWTVEQYKGDFLWRTTDVAIWTTVEVGVGITAGNIATLKPLMQRLFVGLGITSSTAGNNSSKWNRTGKPGAVGYMRDDMGYVLNDLGAIGKHGATTVVIHGGAITPTKTPNWSTISRSESEEEIVPGSVPGFASGIVHSVEFATYEERAYSSKPSPQIDEEKGLPTRPIQTYERL